MPESHAKIVDEEKAKELSNEEIRVLLSEINKDVENCIRVKLLEDSNVSVHNKAILLKAIQDCHQQVHDEE